MTASHIWQQLFACNKTIKIPRSYEGFFLCACQPYSVDTPSTSPNALSIQFVRSAYSRAYGTHACVRLAKSQISNLTDFGQALHTFCQRLGLRPFLIFCLFLARSGFYPCHLLPASQAGWRQASKCPSGATLMFSQSPSEADSRTSFACISSPSQSLRSLRLTYLGEAFVPFVSNSLCSL